MKKRVFAILLCFVLVLTIFSHNFARAADPISFSALSAAAYAMGSSMGISWGFTGSAAAAEQQMTYLLQDFAGTSSIEWWGAGEIKAVAGKLAIVQTGYETVKGVYEHLHDFIVDLIELSKGPFLYGGGIYNGEPIKPYGPGNIGFAVQETLEPYVYYAELYNDNRLLVSNTINGNQFVSGNSVLYIVSSNQIRFTSTAYNSSGNPITASRLINYNITDFAETNPDYTNADKSLYPQALPLEASWQGDWGEAPDTNLEQLIGSVFDNLADLGDIDVTGDIIEPAPAPTPVPSYPPATDVLGGINTEIEQGNDVIQGLNDIQDLMEGVNEGLNDIDLGIGQAAGNISDALGQAAEGVGEAIGTQTGVISGAIDQAVSDVGTAIGQNATVVSGAIDQAVSDIQTSIVEQTQALDESLSATAEGVETIAEALEDETINWQKFDLRGLFPFCIPFDIYNMLEALDASPTAPHVQLPFVIESIGFSYTIDLDFSAFDTVAAVMRQMELIVYGIALAWATSKVIKW